MKWGRIFSLQCQGWQRASDWRGGLQQSIQCGESFEGRALFNAMRGMQRDVGEKKKTQGLDRLYRPGAKLFFLCLHKCSDCVWGSRDVFIDNRLVVTLEMDIYRPLRHAPVHGTLCGTMKLHRHTSVCDSLLNPHSWNRIFYVITTWYSFKILFARSNLIMKSDYEAIKWKRTSITFIFSVLSSSSGCTNPSK